MNEATVYNILGAKKITENQFKVKMEMEKVIEK